jgi:hypothetical protein
MVFCFSHAVIPNSLELVVELEIEKSSVLECWKFAGNLVGCGIITLFTRRGASRASLSPNGFGLGATSPPR